MKIIFSIFFAFFFCTACKKEIQKQDSATSDSTATSPTTTSNNDVNTSKTFDISSIPFTKNDIGTFPYFKLPEGLEPQNKPMERKFDICFFPYNGVMMPIEGKLWKSGITAKKGEEFSQRYFEKSMTDYLEKIGAVKIFDGEITTDEYKRYNKEDPNKGGEGDMGYADQNIKVYVLRSATEGNIYVQFTSTNAMGALNILQQEDFKQTVTKISAATITKDLLEKGKSILYINFDLDKATLTTDGSAVVKEIAKALQSDTKLRIAIEGHTDHTGDATHNQKLSLDRANAVATSLKNEGIANDRLSTKGYGAEKPLVTNDTEENKAKNRRVELIRM